MTASTPAETATVSEHLAQLQNTWEQALHHGGFDAAWLNAGDEHRYFRDDQGAKFKANAYFCQWVPAAYLNAGARLLLQPARRPQLFLPRPEDYWHSVPANPEHLAAHMDIHTFASTTALQAACAKALPGTSRVASIGPPGQLMPNLNEQTGSNEAGVNPPSLLNFIDFHRARKSAYELMLMRTASDIGVRGHIAAKQAFDAGETEFGIHMAYLRASAQSELDLPYGNIIAMDEHAGILHYQQQTRQPQPGRSLLIDAGGNYQGYASDITRSYAAPGSEHDLYRTLVDAMQTLQQTLIAAILPGRRYADLHLLMHTKLATLLVEHKLLTCSADAAYADGLTRAFCPHGLGHLLGLQVHEPGGHLADERGLPAPPPEQDSSLRFTREIAVDQVFTIEPGLYFMPYFLGRLAAENGPLNWPLIDALRPYGGIRIEDNVRVLDNGVENLTRDAFSRTGNQSG